MGQVTSFAQGVEVQVYSGFFPPMKAATAEEPVETQALAGPDLGLSFWEGGGHVFRKGCVAALRASNRLFMVVNEYYVNGVAYEVVRFYDNRELAESRHGPLQDSSRVANYIEKNRALENTWMRIDTKARA
jgi:hypothetical protein